MTSRLARIEQHRRRIWGLCYRMTGDRAAADDLAQESLARAVERADDAASEERFEGWLYRVATNTCLDWLRRIQRERRTVALVDPVDLEELPFAGESNGEATLLRREDVRLAVLTSLQALLPRERAALILRDVLGRSTAETAETMGLTAGHVKVLLHRARGRLERAHQVSAPDTPVDAALVERFAVALEAGDLPGLVQLLGEQVWGLIHDGRGRRRPTLGLRAVARQWQNAFARYGRAAVRRLRVNGEAALLVTQPPALIHLETRSGRVISLRVLLDAARLRRLGLT